MVSQPSMRRMLDEMGTLEGSPTPPAMMRHAQRRQSRRAPHADRPRTCLLGLTVFLLFSAACGQNEGGRCQVNSDCASGLVCKEGTTGNGTCGPQNAVVAPTNDASLAKDLAEDLPVVSVFEVEAEAVVAPQIDDAVLDAGALDSGSLDSTEID